MFAHLQNTVTLPEVGVIAINPTNDFLTTFCKHMLHDMSSGSTKLIEPPALSLLPRVGGKTEPWTIWHELQIKA